MNLPRLVGYFVFFLLPIFLWLLAAAVVSRKGVKARLGALIAGSDNRLSLSRLQAFGWTLVIFGSFAAAMVIHTTIKAGTQAEIDKAKADAQTASQKAETLKATASTRAADAKAAIEAKAAAEKAANDARANENNLPANAPQPNKDTARQAVVAAEANFKTKSDAQANADKAAAEAKDAADKADAESRSATEVAKSYNWVEIPAALLALAGIAIASGVFSSLISAVNSDDKTACITSLGSIPQADLKAHFPDANTTTNPNALSIVGKDMGSSGLVKLDKDRVPILLWKSDGSQIIVDVKDGVAYRTLIVETPNGKLCYQLDGQTPGLILGLAKIRYELSDLFRDDKNPTGFDLMKFQMFGWTLIAIVIYVYLFLSDLRPNLESLPLVPASIVILTGLSQSGYLTGRAVSNAGASERR